MSYDPREKKALSYTLGTPQSVIDILANVHGIRKVTLEEGVGTLEVKIKLPWWSILLGGVLHRHVRKTAESLVDIVRPAGVKVEVRTNASFKW